MPEEFKNIARVAKPHGNRGEVVAVPADGLPSYLAVGMRVAIVPPALRGDRWHEVLRVEHGPAGDLVALSGVVTLAAADELAGKYILAGASDLPADFGLHDVASLIGREVMDAELGPIGCIDEVLQGPANDAWVVTGAFGEVVLPVVDQVVGDVPSQGPIPVLLPAGLVDLSGDSLGEGCDR